MRKLSFWTWPLLALVSAGGGYAAVEWEIDRTIRLEAAPIDVKISPEEKWIFTLIEGGVLLIHSPDGTLRERIETGKQVDRIETGVREDVLFLISRERKTVEILNLDFIRNIDVTGSPAKGPADAPVTIVVFSDFECSYCARLVSLFDEVLARNPRSVRLVFKNFPLNSHPFAQKAATAALAAAAQGKFWEFHDLLFLNYQHLNEEKIRDFSRKLGLDEKKFEEARKDPLIQAQIRKDIQDGFEAGIRGTPTVFVNGKTLRNRTVRGIQDMVDRQLKKRPNN